MSRGRRLPVEVTRGATQYLTEEIGHHLDTILNDADAPGSTSVENASVLRDVIPVDSGSSVVDAATPDAIGTSRSSLRSHWPRARVGWTGVSGLRDSVQAVFAARRPPAPMTTEAPSRRRSPPTRAEGYTPGWRALVLGRSASKTDADESRADAQATAATRGGGAPALEAVTSASRRLTNEERDYFEPRFGHDFGDVRVHAGSGARASARAVDALAYTYGSNVVLGDGVDRLDREDGANLMAHELAHVVQQRGEPRLQRKVRFTPESEEGASAEAIAFFDSVGLPPSQYAFTSFENGRALAEARGTRPTSVRAEIAWSYLKSQDTYERKATAMRTQDVDEREHTTRLASTVGPALLWGSLKKKTCKVNAKFWKIQSVGADVEIRTKSGVDPVDAIDDVRSNPSEYGVECFGSVELLQLIALRDQLGAAEFRAFTRGTIAIRFQTGGGVLSTLTFSNLEEFDVGGTDDTDELIPGDQSNWLNASTSFNQNLIFVGGGRYFAHPAGLVTSKSDFAAKVAAARPANDLYLARYRYRWSQWLP